MSIHISSSVTETSSKLENRETGTRERWRYFPTFGGEEQVRIEFQKRLTLHTEDQRRSPAETNTSLSIDRSIDDGCSRHRYHTTFEQTTKFNELHDHWRSHRATPTICPRFQEHETLPAKKKKCHRLS